MLFTSNGEDCMAFHVFLFLLVFFLLLSLVLLCRHCWLCLQPSHSRGGTIRSTTQRLLKPRTPLDCPDCRLSCAHSSVVGPAPAPVRPWSEVKSRRGAPRASHAQISSVRTSESPRLTSMPSSGMASTARPSRSRPFAARPAVPRSVLDATLHCIG
jgi:hypothetical protein